LLQHQHHPVDWEEWGEEALERARREQKPIFLSVGYSACHWCHVMAHESFEDEAVAAFLNARFVNIKVDREERPDIDAIYMDAVQLLTGQGGWPMSVWLTPDLKPFYAGTYFPPEDRWGRPGFITVLRELDRVFREEPGRIAEATDEIVTQLKRMASPPPPTAGGLDPRIPASLAAQAASSYDARHGGFSGPRGPKFPTSVHLDALLLAHSADTQLDATQRAALLTMIEHTAQRMAAGGMFDHLGGGFHRYSVDERWLIPHFEKMLYDNALLARTYTDLWRVTGTPYYQSIARRTLDWALSEVLDPSGAFWSALDADSEGEEGKFYIWTRDELVKLLGAPLADEACAWWGVTAAGNFEHGTNALHRLDALDQGGAAIAFSDEPESIRSARQLLSAARASRVRPGADDKVIASWNGMMCVALIHAGAAFDEPRYIDAARRCLGFIRDTMITGYDDSDALNLYRIYRRGEVKNPGYLDDYAWIALAMLELCGATGELEWLEGARRLTERMIALFGADSDGLFYTTSMQHTNLLVRQQDIYDGATPSGNAVALTLLLKMSAVCGVVSWRERVERALHALSGVMGRSPHAVSMSVSALIGHTSALRELVLITDNVATSPLVRAAHRRYAPMTVILPVAARDLDAARNATPLLEGRDRLDGQDTAYLCRDGACELPRTSL
jgi:uncharacterized protein YyaL (SSP411 family)